MIGFILRFLPGSQFTWAILGVGLAVAFAGGWKANSFFFASDEVKRLEATLEEAEKANETALEYEKRRTERAKERVKYVEKPVYRDCKPDAEWLRDFNKKITNPS